MTSETRDIRPAGTATPARHIGGVPVAPQELLPLPEPPTFGSVEEERLHRRQKLAGALRLFGRFGFGEGVAGHITVRDPEWPDHFWVNPFGVSFRHMRVSDLVLVNHDGDVVHGGRQVNRAAFVLHAAIHQARPDVVAAAHAGCWATTAAPSARWHSCGRPAPQCRRRTADQRRPVAAPVPGGHDPGAARPR